MTRVEPGICDDIVLDGGGITTTDDVVEVVDKVVDVEVDVLLDVVGIAEDVGDGVGVGTGASPHLPYCGWQLAIIAQ